MGECFTGDMPGGGQLEYINGWERIWDERTNLGTPFGSSILKINLFSTSNSLEKFDVLYLNAAGALRVTNDNGYPVNMTIYANTHDVASYTVSNTSGTIINATIPMFRARINPNTFYMADYDNSSNSRACLSSANNISLDLFTEGYILPLYAEAGSRLTVRLYGKKYKF